MSILGQFVATKLSELAEAFNVGPNTINVWRGRGMPGDKGKYDIVECIHWVRATIWTVDYRKGRSDAVDSGDDDSRAELEKEKIRQEVRFKKLKNSEMEGRLVDRQASKAAVMQLFNIVRARLQAFPEECGNSLPTELRSDSVATWKQKVGLLLTELSNFEKEDDAED